MYFKKIDAGGEGREWSLLYSITSVENDGYAGITRVIDFRAKDIGEAKTKILRFLKKALSHVKKMRGKILAANAVPFDIKNGRRVGSGDEMLRPRFGFSNKRLLRIKDPNKILVRGYGPEAQNQIFGR